MRMKTILMTAVAAPLLLGSATSILIVPAQAQAISKQDIKQARKDATKQLKQAKKDVKQAEKRLKNAQKSGEGVDAAQQALANAEEAMAAAERDLQAAMAARPSRGDDAATQAPETAAADENKADDEAANAAEQQRVADEERRKLRAERRREREQEAAEAQAEAKAEANAEAEAAAKAEAAAEANQQAEADDAASAKAAEQQLLQDERRRKRRAERRERLREQEAKAAAGTTQDESVEIITESEAVGTELDDQQARQVERLQRKLRRQQQQIRDLERAQTEETAENERVVRRTRDGRIIVRRDDQLVIRGTDDDQRFLRNARDVIVEDLPRGRTRIIVTRPNGTKIITIKNRHGDIIYRVRRRPNGQEVVLIDNRDHRSKPGFNVTVELPRLIVPIPRDEYIVDLERADRREIRETLIAPPVERVERVYTLEEVRQNERLRDKVRRIDLDTVTFDTGSAEISPSQVLDLAEIGYALEDVLADDPDAVFLVEGHTDAVGSDYYNLELSDRRAESIAIVLAENFEIPPENLITQGYGEEFLKIPTSGPERANRRVTIRPISDLIRPTGS